MTPDEELADLQKKYALLEGDRKAYYETSQWTIKQNRETIANGKEENKELRLQLGACQSAKGGKPDGGDTETAELEKLINYAKDLRKKYDEIRLLTSKKQGQLNIKLDKIKDLERDAVQPEGHRHPLTPSTLRLSPRAAASSPTAASAKTSSSFSGYEASAWLRPRLRSSGVLQDTIRITCRRRWGELSGGCPVEAKPCLLDCLVVAWKSS